ncbi:hypothetical protein BaRGS_00024885, partial [Batillaria attramentaria]
VRQSGASDQDRTSLSNSSNSNTGTFRYQYNEVPGMWSAAALALSAAALFAVVHGEKVSFKCVLFHIAAPWRPVSVFP